MIAFKISATLVFVLAALVVVLMVLHERDDRYFGAVVVSIVAMNLSLLTMFVILIWSVL